MKQRKRKACVFVFQFMSAQAKGLTLPPEKQKTALVGGFFIIEVPDILISNELLADMRKLADLYDYFKLTGADD